MRGLSHTPSLLQNRKKKMIIYKATNKINGIFYVGQTIRDIDKRKVSHKYNANKGCHFLFHKAIRKYGWNNFKWEVLCECSSKEELDEMEFHYIKQFNSLMPNGYNMTLETSGNLGFDFSGENNPRYNDHRNYEEIHGMKGSERLKKKLSTRMKDAPNNIIHWKKKNPNYNPMNSEKSRKKLSKTRTGGKNPAAKYIYKFVLPNGKTYETDCLREFCRKTGFKRHTLTRMCKNKDYKPKDPIYRGWISEKISKEFVVNG